MKASLLIKSLSWRASQILVCGLEFCGCPRFRNVVFICIFVQTAIILYLLCGWFRLSSDTKP